MKWSMHTTRYANLIHGIHNSLSGSTGYGVYSNIYILTYDKDTTLHVCVSVHTLSVPPATAASYRSTGCA